jgi:hypothetical protein
MQQEHLSKRQEMQQQQLDLYEHWLVEKAKSVFKHKVALETAWHFTACKIKDKSIKPNWHIKIEM